MIVSWTQISSFERCRYLWKRRFLDHWEPAESENIAMRTGTLAHRLIQGQLEGKPVKEIMALDHAENGFWKGQHPARQMAARWLSETSGLRRGAAKIESEAFAQKQLLPDVEIAGQIDVMIETVYGDKRLIDIKTTSGRPSWAAKRHSWSDQVLLYDWLTGYWADDLSYDIVSPDEMITIQLTPTFDMRTAFYNRLTHSVEEMIAFAEECDEDDAPDDDVHRHYHDGCEWCSFNEICGPARLGMPVNVELVRVDPMAHYQIC